MILDLQLAGSSPMCVLSKLLDEYEETNQVDPEHEEDLMNIGAVTYNGEASLVQECTYI